MLKKEQLTNTYIKYIPEITEEIFNRILDVAKEFQKEILPNGVPYDCFKNTYKNFQLEKYFWFGTAGSRYSYGVDNNSQNCKEIFVSDLLGNNWSDACIAANEFIPKEEIKKEIPNYALIKGKWYKWYQENHETFHYGKFKEYGSNVFHMSPWIVNCNSYTVSGTFLLNKAIQIEEISLEEIQTYLPDGHSDKIQKKQTMEYNNMLDIQVGDTVKCVSEENISKYDINNGLGWKKDLEFIVTRVTNYSSHKVYFGGKNGNGVYSDAIILIKRKEEEFILPKKWYIKGCKELAEWQLKDMNNATNCMFSSTTSFYYMIGEDILLWDCKDTPPKEAIEITFDQFKKYVYKKSSSKYIEYDNLIIGETYYCSYKGEDNPLESYIWQYLGKQCPHESKKYYYLKSSKKILLSGTLTDKNFSNNYFTDYTRLATSEEKQWLEVCLKEDKFIPKEIALKPCKIKTFSKKWYIANIYPEARKYLAEKYNQEEIKNWDYAYIGWDGCDSYNGCHGCISANQFEKETVPITDGEFLECVKTEKLNSTKRNKYEVGEWITIEDNEKLQSGCKGCKRGTYQIVNRDINISENEINGLTSGQNNTFLVKTNNGIWRISDIGIRCATLEEVSSVSKEVIEEFKINEWYTYKHSSIIGCYQGNNKGCGIDNVGRWSDNIFMSDSFWKRATKEEIKEELLKYAKKNYPIGTKFHPAHVNSNDCYAIITDDSEIKIDDGMNITATINNENWVSSNLRKYGNTALNRVIFDGITKKWARIIEDKSISPLNNFPYYVDKDFTIGDVVKIINERENYPTFTEAFKNLNFKNTLKNYCKQGDEGTIFNICKHPTYENEVMIAINLSNGNQCLINKRGIKLIRKGTFFDKLEFLLEPSFKESNLFKNSKIKLTTKQEKHPISKIEIKISNKHLKLKK